MAAPLGSHENLTKRYLATFASLYSLFFFCVRRVVYALLFPACSSSSSARRLVRSFFLGDLAARFETCGTRERSCVLFLFFSLFFFGRKTWSFPVDRKKGSLSDDWAAWRLERSSLSRLVVLDNCTILYFWGIVSLIRRIEFSCIF